LIVFFSLAVSLACDPSTLPKGVRISQNGPVLKLTCDPGLQPLEMAYATSPADLLFPVPSKRKFARYVCVDGATYQRINAQGIERSSFFCTDVQSNLCDPLENSAERGHLRVEGAVAIWQSVSGSQRSVLYCAHGVWHRLGGGSLPYGEAAPSALASSPLTPLAAHSLI
uniref:Sushi domain-containing protein n=1 Tax=Taenia asiatica TaxID=60517 RepID=A0A0R3W4S0_TAEAS